MGIGLEEYDLSNVLRARSSRVCASQEAHDAQIVFDGTECSFGLRANIFSCLQIDNMGVRVGIWD